MKFIKKKIELYKMRTRIKYYNIILHGANMKGQKMNMVENHRFWYDENRK